MRSALKSYRCMFDPMFEQMEPRTLLAAAHFVSAVADATSLAVTIDYTSDVNPATLGVGDITFTTSGRATVTATFASGIGNRPEGVKRVTYGLTAYDGLWGASDTGTYIISSPEGAVKDLEGGNLEATDIASLWMWFGVPKAKLISQTVASDALLVVMQYDGIDAINESTIDGSDIVMTGATPSFNRVSQIIHLSPNSIQVVYALGAPQGMWNFSNTGTYTISLAAGQVQDNSANQAPAQLLASYYFWFNSPRAQFLSSTVGGNNWIATVKFIAAPGNAINPASIVGNGAVFASGPDGYYESGHNLTLQNNGDGSFTATFSFVPNGGSWDWLDSGLYTITTGADKVRDASGNFLGAGAIGTTTFALTAPAARIQLPSTPTSTAWDIVINFTDDVAINQSSILATSIRIEGPEGSQLAATLQSVVFTFPNINQATFHISKPQGFVNGAYTIFVNDQAVQDTGGEGIAENAMASFWIWF